MNRIVITLALAALVGATTSAGALVYPATTASAMPQGEHFTLNLIGKAKEMPMNGGGGNAIFVPLEGECRINLSEGEFGVTDKNCSDGSTAGFQLPNPDPENDGVSSYRVYIRALAKPGGSATMNTCREDSDGTWCSTETVYVARAAGQSPGMDVTKETLTVCHDRDGDGTFEREHIFEDENAGYYWKYANSGLRLAQLRFYPNTPTDISAPCPGV